MLKKIFLPNYSDVVFWGVPFDMETANTIKFVIYSFVLMSTYFSIV